jgi:hypothetical protein
LKKNIKEENLLRIRNDILKKKHLTKELIKEEILKKI